MIREETKNTSRVLRFSSLFVAAFAGIWTSAAFLNGLAQVNWSLSELLRQYLIAIGVMKEFHTLVDFYTHIKGVEYVICVLFLCAFPLFFKSINKQKAEASAS